MDNNKLFPIKLLLDLVTINLSTQSDNHKEISRYDILVRRTDPLHVAGNCKYFYV